MSGVKGRWSRLYVGGVELTTKTSSVEIAMAVAQEDVTAFQDTSKVFVGTDTEPTITVMGYVDSLAAGTGGLEDTVRAQLGGDGAQVGVVLSESASTDVGAIAYVMPDANADGMKISTPATGIMTLDGGFAAGIDGLKRGLVLWRGEISATGAKAAVDFGSAGAAGGDVYVFVTAIDGTATNASVTVQSATTSGGTYATEATVTFSAVGAYSAAMTGTINRWHRIDLSSKGGATSINLIVVACVDGVTQP